MCVWLSTSLSILICIIYITRYTSLMFVLPLLFCFGDLEPGREALAFVRGAGATCRSPLGSPPHTEASSRAALGRSYHAHRAREPDILGVYGVIDVGGR